MGTAKTVMYCGFLATIFLVSGISTLRCHSTSSIVQNGSWVEIPTEVSIGNKIITCSKDQDACVEAQVTLSIAQTFLLVTHRGCAVKDLDGAGTNSSGDPHFTITSNVRYCFKDLCNQEMTRVVPWRPGTDTVPEESSSTQCYSGLMLDPKESLEGVTCRKGYNQCYHGHGTIQTGPLAVSVLIKTCRRPPCIAPKSQTFGPVEILQWGSCCVSSYCNGMETAPQIQDATGDHSTVTISPATSFTKLDAEKGKGDTPTTSAFGAGLPGRPFQQTTTSPDTVYSTFDYTFVYNYDDNLNQPGWKPGIPGEAVRFQNCPISPLLIALGIAVFGAWW